MTAGVYVIVNKADGFVYVGSSVNIERRWCCHRSDLKLGIGPSKSMVAAWQTVGPRGFAWAVLETVDNVDGLESAEQHWMDQYTGRLYNRRKWARRARPLKGLRAIGAEVVLSRLEREIKRGSK